MRTHGATENEREGKYIRKNLKTYPKQETKDKHLFKKERDEVRTGQQLNLHTRIQMLTNAKFLKEETN